MTRAQDAERRPERYAAVPLRDLPDVWRSRADDLRIYAEPVARAFMQAADDLERVLRAEDDTLLTLSGAAELSGYSVDHLGRLIKKGAIPNAGRPHAPRIRRRDLPRRPSRVAPDSDVAYDPNADARALSVRLKEKAV